MQALIACRRYPDAAIAAERAQEGQDKLCLQAEVQWRQGDIDAAAAALAKAHQHSADRGKCQELQQWILSLQQKMHVAQGAFEDGEGRIWSVITMLSQIESS